MLVLLLSVGFQMKIMEEMAFSLSFLSRDKEAWRRSELLTAPPISPCFTMGGLTVGAGEPCSESKKAKQGAQCLAWRGSRTMAHWGGHCGVWVKKPMLVDPGLMSGSSSHHCHILVMGINLKKPSTFFPPLFIQRTEGPFEKKKKKSPGF